MNRNTRRKIWVFLITSLLFSCVPEQKINETVNELKVTIDEESFYAIPDSLLKKYGFIVDDYENLALFNNEKPIPFWIDSAY